VRFRRAILIAPGFNTVDSTVPVDLPLLSRSRYCKMAPLQGSKTLSRRIAIDEWSGRGAKISETRISDKRCPSRQDDAVRKKPEWVGKMRLVFIFGANRIETPTSRHSPSGIVVVRSSGARQPAFSHAYTSPRSNVAAADGRAQDSCTVRARRGTRQG